jgi:predicted DsbA family dithiol-disulfide isomerase
MSQSHLAHRLTEYAGQLKPESQLAVSMDIFDLYHVNGVHLSDREGLAEIGVKHGLFSDKDGGLAWLAGNACDLEVKKQYQTAQRMGITGVPFFVFQDKYAASGAMGVDEFVEVSRCSVSEVWERGRRLGRRRGRKSCTAGRGGAVCVGEHPSGRCLSPRTRRHSE